MQVFVANGSDSPGPMCGDGLAKVDFPQHDVQKRCGSICYTPREDQDAVDVFDVALSLSNVSGSEVNGKQEDRQLGEVL